MATTFSLSDIFNIVLFAVAVVTFILSRRDANKKSAQSAGNMEQKMSDFIENIRCELAEFKSGAKERTSAIGELKENCVDFERHLQTHDEHMAALTQGINGIGERVNEHDRKIAHIEGRQELIEGKLQIVPMRRERREG